LIPGIQFFFRPIKGIITADGLYSKQPFRDAVKQARMSYILVAKPTDHQELFQWVRELGGCAGLELTDNKGRIHQYRWVNRVPLNGLKKMPMTSISSNTNWFPKIKSPIKTAG
jgi:hypothetical protein